MATTHKRSIPTPPRLWPWRLTRHAGFLGGLLLLALGLRLYRLGAQSLWLDEGSTWAEVTGRTGKGWLTLIGELWSKDAAYPLYHLLLKAWVALAGDSAWALRLPSALAGAGAVLAVFLAATRLGPWTKHSADQMSGGAIAAGLLFATAPFALWHAQDAKVYSLLMLVVALLIWCLLRATSHAEPRAWRLVIGIALISVFVHRLALLSLAAAALAYTIIPMGRRRWRLGKTHTRLWSLASAWWPPVLTMALALAAVLGTVLAVRSESQGSGGHIAAGALQGLWLTFAHFSLDQGNIAGVGGLPLMIWSLPYAALTLWGLLLLLGDARHAKPGALVVLCMFVLPLALFSLALAFTHIYEARYVTASFPAWVLVLAYPVFHRRSGWVGRALSWGLLGAALVVNALVLLQPQHGLFSGAPVKEQWRDAITTLARQAQPDDLIILHPYYIQPLWDYYAPRVTPDPLPQPVAFTGFKEGFIFENTDPNARRERFRREYEPVFNQQATGKKRMLLLIAPDHAQTIDPPKTLEELRNELQPGQPAPTAPDRYGWLGLRFQYAQQTWGCGSAVFVGVELMCQSFPETFNPTGPGTIPQPQTTLEAVFGGELQLRGYTLSPHGGALRPGGSLPITLFWQAATKPTRDYTMFLHLCHDCALPPLAQDDHPPLGGDYSDPGHTTTWRIGDPVHDERAILLQDSNGNPLPPGRYTLLLGVYPRGNPGLDARLPVVSAAQSIEGTRLVLGQVTILTSTSNEQ